jgi:hypothetical protein
MIAGLQNAVTTNLIDYLRPIKKLFLQAQSLLATFKNKFKHNIRRYNIIDKQVVS